MSVVVPGLQDDDVVIGDVVDEAVGFVDAARPCARQDVLERFRLADSGERVAEQVGDELVDAPRPVPRLVDELRNDRARRGPRSRGVVQAVG